MSHWTQSYANMPRYIADEKAIEDIKSYCNDKLWAILIEEADKTNTIKDWQGLNSAMSFAGIQGYPVHAFGRRYCLTAYRAWMHDGKDPVPTDEHGFVIASPSQN